MEEGAAGAIYWKGVEYKLLELHTHTPSEHKVKNQRYVDYYYPSNPREHYYIDPRLLDRSQPINSTSH
jgi:hypothetical protein